MTRFRVGDERAYRSVFDGDSRRIAFSSPRPGLSTLDHQLFRGSAVESEAAAASSNS